MDDRSPGETFEQACERVSDANSHMLDGDWSVWKELLTARDDVTLLGAYGAYARGWADVSARFERTAGGYAGGGGTSTSDNIARWASADLGCTVDLERHITRLDGKAEPVVFTYRVTHLLRREADGWKVVLRHADPLDTFRGPEFAHAGAAAER